MAKTGKKVIIHHTLTEILGRVKTTKVKVGVFDDVAPYPDGTRVAQVAAWNEYGTQDSGGNSPQRAFLNPTVIKHRRKYQKMIQELVAKSMEKIGYTATKGFIKVGKTGKRDVETAIATFSTPANAESTQAAKGNPSSGTGTNSGAGINSPLIDSGRMLNSIDWGYYKK